MPRSLSSRRSLSDTPRRAPVRRTKTQTTHHEHYADSEAHAPPVHEVLFQEGLVAPHHKQALIMAHAHARSSRRHPATNHRWIYAVGMSVCSLAVLFGWWLTVGNWLRTQWQLVNTRSMQQEIQRQAQELEQNWQLVRPSSASLSVLTGKKPEAPTEPEEADATTR